MSSLPKSSWLSYRTLWRFHFYAGLFCIPFVLWLSATGSIYLFRPQVEAWLDRPYDTLTVTGARATPRAQVEAALAAVPGSSFHSYEIPSGESSAVRVRVGEGGKESCVYLHPQTLQVLQIVREDRRPMQIVLKLHGELLAGDAGSRVVELVASWAILLVASGLCLWWPRSYHFTVRQKTFWRDLHAVIGASVSLLALAFLITGLPWAAGWGAYLKAARTLAQGHTVHQDWPIGAAPPPPERSAVVDLEPLNRLLPSVAALQLAAPAMIYPPKGTDPCWSAHSNSQNRTLRDTVYLDPATAAVVRRDDFRSHPFLDRAIQTGVSAHEGHLFGVANELLNLATTVGLCLASLSALMLWTRRRKAGSLGAPAPDPNARVSPPLVLLLAGLALALPLFGLSLVFVYALDRAVLSRFPRAQSWLGFQSKNEFAAKRELT